MAEPWFSRATLREIFPSSPGRRPDGGRNAPAGGRWEWDDGRRRGRVRARTRGEARARVKAALGIRGRLPAGVMLRRAA